MKRLNHLVCEVESPDTDGKTRFACMPFWVCLPEPLLALPMQQIDPPINFKGVRLTTSAEFVEQTEHIQPCHTQSLSDFDLAKLPSGLLGLRVCI